MDVENGATDPILPGKEEVMVLVLVVDYLSLSSLMMRMKPHPLGSGQEEMTVMTARLKVNLSESPQL